ncbi:transcriptional regulator [Metasolibacillus sp. FSL H7-0170]|uniref:transcriptional regulator n=1 Tax=Metasolibacillus sp. FSL H7-0170 TaxID=2921431 RepID=UPI0031587385
MRNQLIKAMQRGQLIDIMYMAKDGKISKRRVKIIKITDDTMQVYCFNKCAKRTFIVDNTLAIMPVSRREREVI